MQRSPFPGVDPFIEARGLWPDFHHHLVVSLANALNVLLPPRYVAQLGERTFRDSVEVLVEGPTEFEERENFVEIRDLDDQDNLVTCIEVLSPTNKRPGTSGWYEYERKRSLLFQGAANFVEIDLLRGGQRHAMKGQWPSSPYCLLVLWKDRAPWSRVWPTRLTEPILPLPIPLLPPDPDVILELQPLIDAIYGGSRYTRRLRYHDPIDPPLSPDEAALLKSVQK